MALYQVNTGGTVQAADVNQYYNLLTGATTDQPVTIANRIRATNTGASTNSGYMGGVSGAAPTSGTFATGDLVIDQKGPIWVCTAGGTPGTWSANGLVLISRQTLGADAASITFSSIPTTFTHLRLMGQVRSTTAATSDVLVTRLNSDTGNNYDFTTTVWNDVATPGTASVGSGGLTSGMRIAPAIPAASATASFFGHITADVPHYSDATNNRMKGVMCQSVNQGFVIGFGFGEWVPATPTAVTAIQLYCNANLKAGSSVSLYGIP